MIVTREDRAVFTHQLEDRRNRGGRPRCLDPKVTLTVRVPETVFDAACQRAQREGVSLPEIVRDALAREFSYSLTARSSSA